MHWSWGGAVDWFQRWGVVITFGATVIGGGWTYYKWHLHGADDWMVNVSVETEILPYDKDKGLYLLVVHAKAKNPTDTKVEFGPSLSAYTITVARLPQGMAQKGAPELCKGEPLARFDLMHDSGDGYNFIPGAEIDDRRAVVVGKGLVCVQAYLERRAGRREEPDYVDASKVIDVQ